MTKQNNVLRVAIATMFAVGAGASHAALYTAAGAAFSATKVASELPTTGITLTSSGAELTAGSTITTFAPSAGQNLQINVALSNGAKFGAAPVVFCHEAVSGSAIAATLNLGGAGADSGTWTLASTAIGDVTTATSISACFVSATTLTVTGAHADAGITFNFTYGTLASSTVNGTYVTFARGVTGEVTPGTDIVMNVVSGFVTTTAGATLVSAGTVDFKSNGSAASTATNLAAKIELESVMAAGSGSITVAGASLAATKATAGVWLVTAAMSCNTAAGSVVASATGGVASVTFTGLDSATMSGGVNVCFQFDGTTAVPAGSITASVGATAQTGYTLNTAVGGNPLINITRNGTTMVAPLVQVPSGWLSRMVITNAGSAAAAYTVSAVSETGNTVTLTGAAASGTVDANSTTVVDLPTLMTATGTNRASFVVTVAGTNANISGLYQIVNSATGALSNYVMVTK